MIVDAFLFDAELDMLELRLHTLADVVDRFVLCEAPETFTGQPKPLAYAEHADEPRFAPFRDRITHVVVDDLPATGNPWPREHFQRNAIMRGLPRRVHPNDPPNHVGPDDVILVSDVDEIPNPAYVKHIEDYLQQGEIVAFRQTLYQFTVNWRHPQPWYGTRAIRYRYLRLPQHLRLTTGTSHFDVVIQDGGWSFSSMGGIDAVSRKLSSFSHQEANTPELNNPEHIASVIASGSGLAPWDAALEYQPLDDTYPRYLLEHRDRFESWLHDRELAREWAH